MFSNYKHNIYFLGSVLLLIVFLVLLDYCTTASNCNIHDKEYNEAKAFLQKHKEFRKDYCVFVDFGRNSGFDRLYIVDMENRNIVFSDKCSHGKGGNSTWLTPNFSNEIGSKCSSIGFYKIAESGTMHRYPKMKCIRLDGLSPTNSNARVRGILIHLGHPAFRIFSFPVPLLLGDSEGCFGTTKRCMYFLETLKQQQSSPLLLYAYS